MHVQRLLLILSVEQHIQILRRHPEDLVRCASLPLVAELLEVGSPIPGLRLGIVLRPTTHKKKFLLMIIYRKEL